MNIKSTSTVRFQIITILVGLSLDKAISKIADKASTAFTILCIVYFTINILNFYHAKIVTTESPEYKPGKNEAIYEIMDYLLNSLLMIGFLIVALYVDEFKKFLFANIALRLVDLAMIGHSFISVSRSKRGGEMLRANLYWAAYSTFTILLLAMLIVSITHCHMTVALWMPGVLLASVIVDIALDYSINWHFYFPSEPEVARIP
jgi:hypothetical protein